MIFKRLVVFCLYFTFVHSVLFAYFNADNSPLSRENNDRLTSDTLLNQEILLSDYEQVLCYIDSLVEVTEKMGSRIEVSKDRDSILCNKIIYYIEKIQIHLEEEMYLKDMKLNEKSDVIEKLDIERSRISTYFLISVAILSIGLLILMYSRYRIALNARKKLEEKQKECSYANEQLKLKNEELSTNKKKLEKLNEELSSANHKLSHSEKELKETNFNKDKFFSIISHDLRNPFASIASFSRIIKREIDAMSKEELKELAFELDKSVLKINTLLDNLLIWSRSQSGKTRFQPRYVNLYDIIKETSELFEGNAKEKEISININIDDDFVVYGDSNMLEAIARNLLTNAIKYSKNGGRVIFKSHIEDNTAYVSVEDEGVGISVEDKEKVLDSNIFFSTYGTSDEKGSGLGLKITKEFVNKQGGEIYLQSDEGKGSIFTFTIPLEED